MPPRSNGWIELMDQDQTLRANTPTVIGEVIDDDVVLINFETGTYYLLGGAGAEIWPMLERGASLAAIAARLGERHQIDNGDLRTDLETWLGELLSENLIAAVDAGSDGAGRDAKTADSPDDVGAYAPPTVTRFDDMQEMLLLDPIHDVTEAGWPHRPTDRR